MIAEIIYKVLFNTSAVTDLTAVYTLVAGGETMPAIFTLAELPDNTKYPAIRVFEVGGIDFGCRANRGMDAQVDVRVLGDKDTSLATLRDLAMEAWKAVNRANVRSYLEDEGYESWGCRADPPQYAPDEDGFPGFLIPVRLRFLEVDS